MTPRSRRTAVPRTAAAPPPGGPCGETRVPRRRRSSPLALALALASAGGCGPGEGAPTEGLEAAPVVGYECCREPEADPTDPARYVDLGETGGEGRVEFSFPEELAEGEVRDRLPASRAFLCPVSGIRSSVYVLTVRLVLEDAVDDPRVPEPARYDFSHSTSCPHPDEAEEITEVGPVELTYRLTADSLFLYGMPRDSIFLLLPRLGRVREPSFLRAGGAWASTAGSPDTVSFHLLRRGDGGDGP